MSQRSFGCRKIIRYKVIQDKRISIVLPAYNAEKTLKQTFKEIPFDIVDHVILVDDKSSDQTLTVAHELGIEHIIEHEQNLAKGGKERNQKVFEQRAAHLRDSLRIHCLAGVFNRV